MGLFTQRPEESNDEWAGLPSEPLRDESAAERLAAPVSNDPLGLGSVLGSAPIGSILIPVTPYIEIAETQSTDGE